MGSSGGKRTGMSPGACNLDGSEVARKPVPELWLRRKGKLNC